MAWAWGLRPTGQSVKKPFYVEVWVKEFGTEAAMRSESMRSLLVRLPLNSQESTSKRAHTQHSQCSKLI